MAMPCYDHLTRTGLHGRPAYAQLISLGVFLSVSFTFGALPDFTCYNVSPVLASNHIIGGYKSGSDINAGVSFERVLDTGGGETLPTGSYSTDERPEINLYAGKYTMPSAAGDTRIGVYNCIFDQPSTNITTIILPANGDIQPQSPTVTTSVGENVTLTVTFSASVAVSDLRWKHNGHDVTEWNGQSAVTINDADAINAGIYECYQDGNWAAQKHALMKLIVRECPVNKWGSSCDGNCPVCHNGGMCDDRSGKCLCAPGFTGDFCEILFGKNRFGHDCGITCSQRNIDGCRGNLMCLQDPFGCTCAAGFTGLDCRSPCVDEYFGADCSHQCHCDGAAVCDKGTGTCPSGVPCDEGYRGENCQNSCQLGEIGVDACVTCPVPIAVKNFNITVSSTTTRQLAWSAASNMCPVSNYSIQHELVNQDQCQPASGNYIDVATVDTQSSSYTWQVRNDDDPQYLPYSTYKIRVRAKNEAGLGQFEGVTFDEFTTAEGRPQAPPDNVEFFNSTDDSVSFQWDEVPCGSRGGLVTLYIFNLSTTYDVQRRSSYEMSVRIDDAILPCTDYTLQVAALTTYGPGPYSNRTSVTTSSRVHGAVANLNTSAGPAPDELQVSWDAPDTSRNPCSIEFIVEYELITRDQCETLSSPRRVPYGLGGDTGLIIGGLEAHSTYKVYVRTSNEAGESDEKSIQSITSSKAPQAPPSNVEFFNSTDESVSFQWDEVSCGSRGGVVSLYMFNLSTAFDFMSGSSYEMSVRIDDAILPCTDYTLQVAALTTYGPGPYSNRTSVTTSTRAHGPVANLNTSAGPAPDELQVSWDAPDTSRNPCSIEFIVEYELITRDQCETLSSPRRVPYGLGGDTGLIIGGLEAHSTYEVYVRTSNEAGESDEKSIQSISSSKEPTKAPADFTSTNQTKTSIRLAWGEIPCGERNADIVGYSLDYRVLEKPYNKTFQPSASFTPVDISESAMLHTVTGLEPSTKYEFRLAGVARLDVDTPGPYGVLDINTAVETDIKPPAEPSVESSLTTSTTVTITLSPPAVSTYITDFQISVQPVGQASAVPVRAGLRHYGPSSAVSLVNRYVTAEFSKEDLPDTFTVGDNGTYGGYRNLPLQAETEYDIYLGSVSSTSETETVVFREEPLRVKVAGSNSGNNDSQGGFPVAALVVPFLLIILVGLAVGVIFIRRRARKQTLSSDGINLDSSNDLKDINLGTFNAAEEICNSEEAASIPSVPSQSLVVATKPKPTQRKRQASHQPVALADFEDYVWKKKHDSHGDANGFLRDYKILPDGTLNPSSVARHEQNRAKNRYANIIPYDDSRVVLEELPGDPHSDYVNASYIDGFNEAMRYIASQGPNKASVTDMWRMVWQENTPKVVMLTNVLEGDKIKCAQYWPDDTATYGQLTVRQQAEERHVDYTIRDFKLQKEGQSTRNVRQYHFTSWPDMGVPYDPSKVISFVKMVKAYSSKDTGPMVVHCSAGVGRTGAYIVLDAMLDQARIEGKVDIWNFARRMRDRRMKMIQTAAQYEFVFDALLEEFKYGGTSIQADAFRSELAGLKKTNSNRTTGLQEQFEKLTRLSSIVSSDQCLGGRDPKNVGKNRFPDKIPVDRFRPRLMTEGGDGSTDYINACFLSSHSAKGAYIATQMPLPGTVGDLWRMVYDYNCSCIVMLNNLDDKDPTFGKYWTDAGSLTCPPLDVSLESTEKMPNNITVRYLTLTNAKTKVSRMLCHLQLPDWPSGRVPASPVTVLQLVAALREWQCDHTEARIVIHCIDGEGASGTFCALLNILEKLKDENVVDVFHAVRKLREARPGMVQSLEEYTFLYDAVRTHMESDIVYENVQAASIHVSCTSQV
ncbi:receptor-type tyrosine-protein phosphatase T-like [Patiria miniata]|uniref:protein-tyrosine-phosphatase n=1 Tax=Patiria miniata TaxID=46514 RepID=A0A913ZYL7_PATMI|nr:receptor-type tyrosine-protein phosphatase T-like [Patiria miniata]